MEDKGNDLRYRSGPPSEFRPLSYKTWVQSQTVSDSKYSAMIGCLRTRVRKQPIIALYFESKNELKFYDLKAWSIPKLRCLSYRIGNINIYC